MPQEVPRRNGIAIAKAAVLLADWMCGYVDVCVNSAARKPKKKLGQGQGQGEGDGDTERQGGRGGRGQECLSPRTYVYVLGTYIQSLHCYFPVKAPLSINTHVLHCRIYSRTHGRIECHPTCAGVEFIRGICRAVGRDLVFD